MGGPCAPRGLFATATAVEDVRHQPPPPSPSPAEICAPLTAAGDIAVLFEDGREEALTVDKKWGPVWVSEADGKPMKRHGPQGNGKVAPDDGGFGGSYAKKWRDLSSTEREVQLLITARRQRSLREAAAWRSPQEQQALVVRAPPKERLVRLVPRGVVPGKAPLLVCWYSGGFFKQGGEKLLAPFLKAASVWGVKEYLVLHHTNEYGFKGEGYKDWPAYVDRLVKEINKVTEDRPLLLFGHSKGVCPAMSVATRLRQRVIKVYLTSCGAWEPQQPTPWELSSHDFKRGTDQGLMAWFSSLNPADILLRRAAEAHPSEFSEIIKNSPFLSKMLDLMKLQYKDAMYPDMKNRVIDVFPADVCSISPVLDPGSSLAGMRAFGKFTTGHYQTMKVQAGHMDILSNQDFHAMIYQDMKQYYP
mmetsp:Transcript_93334/g.291035  ORF Transcript_93334/g.291035 Transcript_93334/m.291035 type:complete len:417 (+) Transcript_93334:61-1311(+)